MLKMKNAEFSDWTVWSQSDPHLTVEQFRSKVASRKAFLFYEDKRLVGIFRYNMFWDHVPFVTLIFLVEDERGKGYGREVMEWWETMMRSRGYELLMVSAPASETAQHFFRELGYTDCGCLLVEGGLELFMSRKI